MTLMFDMIIMICEKFGTVHRCAWLHGDYHKTKCSYFNAKIPIIEIIIFLPS